MDSLLILTTYTSNTLNQMNQKEIEVTYILETFIEQSIHNTKILSNYYTILNRQEVLLKDHLVLKIQFNI